MKRFLISFTAVLMAVVLCCSAGFASAPGEFDPGDIDMGALADALGLSEEELEKLTEGELDVSDIDLGQVDLGAVVEAVGMTREEALESITEGMDADVDLSNIDLSQVDVEQMVDSIGLTDEDLNHIFQGKTEQIQLNPFNIDVGGFAQSIGLDEAQTKQIIQSTMDLDPEIMGVVDVTKVNLKALAAALGLTPDEMMELVQGALPLSSLDLSKIDLGALVGALGMTGDDVLALLSKEIGIEGLDLTVLDLEEVDLVALVDALGLSEDQLSALLENELDPSTLDLTALDIPAALDALGLTVLEAAQLGLAFAGMGHVDLIGTVRGIGRGALTGLIAAAVVVLIIIILLAVTGRKKRSKKQAAPVAVESVPEE